MDISTEQVPANNCEIRGRTPTTALNLSRESLMASSGRATPYYDRMDDKMDCKSTSGDMTPELFYETEQEKTLCTSKAVSRSLMVDFIFIFLSFSFSFSIFRIAQVRVY